MWQDSILDRYFGRDGEILGNSELIKLVIAGDVEGARNLLAEHPEQVDDRDGRTGLTALHIFAGNRNIAGVQMLCTLPQPPKLQLDGWGRSPVELAAQVGSKEIDDLLMPLIIKQIIEWDEAEQAAKQGLEGPSP